jgi:hypothetical protein
MINIIIVENFILIISTMVIKLNIILIFVKKKYGYTISFSKFER